MKHLKPFILPVRPAEMGGPIHTSHEMNNLLTAIEADVNAALSIVDEAIEAMYDTKIKLLEREINEGH